jgi:hypothetical protein
VGQGRDRYYFRPSLRPYSEVVCSQNPIELRNQQRARLVHTAEKPGSDMSKGVKLWSNPASYSWQPSESSIAVEATPLSRKSRPPKSRSSNAHTRPAWNRLGRLFWKTLGGLWSGSSGHREAWDRDRVAERRLPSLVVLAFSDAQGSREDPRRNPGMDPAQKRTPTGSSPDSWRTAAAGLGRLGARRGS